MLTVVRKCISTSPDHLAKSFADASAGVDVRLLKRTAADPFETPRIHLNKTFQDVLSKAVNHGGQTLNSVQEDIRVVVLDRLQEYRENAWYERRINVRFLKSGRWPSF